MARPILRMGQAGNRSFHSVPSAVAVAVEGNDVIMDGNLKKVTLHPGDSATVEINITRDHYDGPIEMNVVLWNLTQTFTKSAPTAGFQKRRGTVVNFVAVDFSPRRRGEHLYKQQVHAGFLVRRAVR